MRSLYVCLMLGAGVGCGTYQVTLGDDDATSSSGQLTSAPVECDPNLELDLTGQCRGRTSEAIAIQTLRELHLEQTQCIADSGALCPFTQLTALVSTASDRLSSVSAGPGGGCVAVGPGGGCEIGPGGGCVSIGPGGGCISVGPGGGCISVGPGGGCLEGISAFKAGYMFSLRALPTALSDGGFSWGGEAHPIVYKRTGVASFYIDETGILLGQDIGGDAGTSQMPEI